MRYSWVVILALIPVVLFAADPNQNRGFSPDRVFQIGDVDHVNVFNGNLMIRIPIGQEYSVGPVLKYRLTLTYNSKLWDYKFEPDNIPVTGCLPGEPCGLRWAELESYSNAGFGWILTMGRIIPPRNEQPEHGWIYIGADGSQHEFKYVIDPGEPAQIPPWLNPDIAETIDGSHLRFKHLGTRVEVAFPDGLVQRFHLDGDLEEIRDRHGNWVRVEYLPTQWVITDGYGSNTARTHYVNFYDKSTRYTWDNFEKVVSSVSLQAFDNQTATYSFSYEDRWIGRGGDGERLYGYPTRCVTAPLLENIQLPDGSAFDPAYKSMAAWDQQPAVCNDSTTSEVEEADQGAIQSLKLPTQGVIEWTYGTYPMNMQACRPNYGFEASYTGVRTRRVTTAVSAPVAEWTYTPERVKYIDGSNPLTWSNMFCGGDDGTTIASPAEEFTVTVQTPDKLKTKHYFSAYPVGAMEKHDPSPHGFWPEEYGMPFTRKASAYNPVGYVASDPLTNRALSTEVFDSSCIGCAPLRRSYVVYQDDGWFADTLRNSRIAVDRTVFLEPAPLPGDPPNCGTDCYTDVRREDYDGAGHYRKSIFTSNFPGAVERTTFVNYMPDTANWLLEMYTDSWIKQGSGTTATGTKTVAAFDDTLGVLKSVRRIRTVNSNPSQLLTGPNDLLTSYCRDTSTTAGTRGFVTSERYLGGDGASIPSGDPCTATRADSHYFLDHSYTFNGANLDKHTAQYAGTSHLVVDEDFDWRTGLVKTTRDSSGLTTEYTYDSSSRLKTVTPPGSVTAEFLRTTYTYTPATQNSPAKVGALTGTTPATNPTTLEFAYEYDGLGRMTLEKRLMPDGTWSGRKTEYDLLGRKKSVSEWESVPETGAFTPQHKTLFENYDPFDRVGKITVPDGSSTAYDYFGGVRRTKRSGYGGGDVRIAVESTEMYDSSGRLIGVDEKDRPGGMLIKTSYGYDSGNRLMSVKMSTDTGGAIQNRYFDYDGRGLLRWESHPESGLKSYSYDARGELLTVELGAAQTPFDLKYTYDAAGRPLTLEGRKPDAPSSYRPLKVFTYATANDLSVSPADYRKGKLATATRYNYRPASTFGQGLMRDVIRVAEAYTYQDMAGRRTNRVTSIATSPDGLCCWDEAKEITQRFSYDPLGYLRTTEYPMCDDCGMPPSYPPRNLSSYFTHGRVTSLADVFPNETIDWVRNLSYWPNGMRNSLRHGNDMYDTQTVDPSGMPRPGSIRFQTYIACKAPNVISLTPPVAAVASNSVLLQVTAGGTSPFTYKWFNDGVQVGTGASYTATATGYYYVEIENACRMVQSNTITVKIGSCVAPWFTNSTSVPNTNGTFTLSVEAFGTGALTYSWKRLSDNAIVSTNQTYVTPPLAASESYQVTVAHSCSGNSASGVVDATVPGPAITLTATQKSASWIELTWNAIPGATSYTILRRTNGTGLVPLQTGIAPTVTKWDDLNLTADKAYVYVIEANGVATSSAPELGTTVVFSAIPDGITQDPFNELLRAVNAVRGLSGWNAVTWSNILSPSDPLVAPGTQVLSKHVLALRFRLNEALSAAGFPISGYSEPDLASKVIVKSHITELRSRVQ